MALICIKRILWVFYQLPQNLLNTAGCINQQYTHDNQSHFLIIILFSLIALHKENKFDPKRPKKTRSIQYGNRKCEPMHECWPQHEQIWKKINRERRREEKSDYGKKQSGQKMKWSLTGQGTVLPTVPLGSLLPKAVDELPNLPFEFVHWTRGEFKLLISIHCKYKVQWANGTRDLIQFHFFSKLK